MAGTGAMSTLQQTKHMSANCSARDDIAWSTARQHMQLAAALGPHDAELGGIAPPSTNGGSAPITVPLGVQYGPLGPML